MDNNSCAIQAVEEFVFKSSLEANLICLVLVSFRRKCEIRRLLEF